MEPGTQGPVQLARDEWFFRRDEPSGSGSSGARRRTNRGPVSVRAIYLGIALIVAAACLVDAFSVLSDAWSLAVKR
jgi:hypothetical protein